MNKKIVTSCKNCCFAEYDGDVQKSCALNLLEQYKDVQEAYDDDKEFFIINNVACDQKRSKTWYDLQDDPYRQIEQEICIKYDAIVLVNSDDFIPTIESFKYSSILPEYLHIIFENKYVERFQEIEDIVKSLNIKYKLEFLYEGSPTRTDADVVINNLMISPWYLIMEAPDTLPPNYIHNINEKINWEKQEFGIVKPFSYAKNSGLFVLKHFHNALGLSSINIENETDKLCISML